MGVLQYVLRVVVAVVLPGPVAIGMSIHLDQHRSSHPSRFNRIHVRSTFQFLPLHATGCWKNNARAVCAATDWGFPRMLIVDAAVTRAGLASASVSLRAEAVLFLSHQVTRHCTAKHVSHPLTSAQGADRTSAEYLEV